MLEVQEHGGVGQASVEAPDVNKVGTSYVRRNSLRVQGRKEEERAGVPHSSSPNGLPLMT